MSNLLVGDTLDNMLSEIIKKRKSIRKYDPNGVVTDEQVRAMLEAAMLAPSAVNSRPWEFIVVRDRGKLDAITEYHPYTQMLKTAPVAIVISANPNALNNSKIANMEFWQQDCGAATQNILLQATHMGLGTCWCGLYPNQVVAEATRKLFDIPSDRIPFCVIAVGVSAEEFGGRGHYDEKKVRWI